MSRPSLVKSLLLLVFFLPVYASALTISPTKIEVAIDPGQTAIGEIEVFNEQDETKTFYTTFENFEPRGETGSPYFTGSGSGLASWIAATERFEIKPGERIAIAYSISVPEETTAGGYFAGIFFGTQPPTSEGGGEVSIGGKVGSLVLLRVNGDIAESGGILDFTTLDKNRFFSTLPISFTYRFNNTGADRVVPKGEIVIKNSIAQKSANVSANATEGSILPSSIRKFEVAWNEAESLSPEANFFATALYQLKNFHLGLYKANIELVWGESAQRGTASTWFFLFPWQLLTLVAAAGVLFRSYHSFVVRRAKSTK